MMDLRKIGYDDWFAAQAPRMLQPGQQVARVTAVDRNACLVRGEEGREVGAELAGRLLFSAAESPDLPCVGDWVCVRTVSPDLVVIQAVLPRKTFLRRRRPGKGADVQMIAANIDMAFVVQSCRYDFNTRRLDRYLVACADGGIEPVVLLSKTDLLPPDEAGGLVLDLRGAGVGARIIPVSSETGEGLAQLDSLLEPGKTYCLVGSSGVGKSTLINRLTGRNALETRAVSATGEGTHATTRRQLLVLDSGAMLIDTPGMRELGLMDADDGLDEGFADIQALSRACRFADCTHLREPGCAVLRAIEDQELSRERYQSYLKLKKENEHASMSHVEKRRKDREFGKYVKSVMKGKQR